jgi:hypothetical protein
MDAGSKDETLITMFLAGLVKYKLPPACRKVAKQLVPGWSDIDEAHVEVSTVTGGITNQCEQTDFSWSAQLLGRVIAWTLLVWKFGIAPSAQSNGHQLKELRSSGVDFSIVLSNIMIPFQDGVLKVLSFQRLRT